jgi:hypothetical protein
MNRVQKQKHLAQANRHIAELAVQILRQRVIVKHALDTGQRSEMAVSLLDALEGSLRIFEKHRIFLLSCSINGPSKRIIQRPDPPRLSHNGSGLATTPAAKARHDQLTRLALPLQPLARLD